MQNFQNLGAGGGGGDHFLTKPPKGTSLADPFTRFVASRLDEKRDTTKSHRVTYLRGIPHSTKFSQMWHLSRGRRRNQPY